MWVRRWVRREESWNREDEFQILIAVLVHHQDNVSTGM